MTLYRMVVWYVRGKKAYTKSGFQEAAKRFNAKDLDVNLTGRSFIVTGANSGIGKSTCMALAAKGGIVHMLCRSRERGEEARAEISKETKNDNIFLHVVDMADTKGIKKFADDFIAANQPAHVLVNNAGCMVHERKLTADGMESNFAVNTFGTYLLTALLVPHMLKFEDPRVVTVSSGGMLLAKLDAEDRMLEKQPFKGEDFYSQQKRQQVVMMEEFTKKYPKISFYSCHPGWADTPAVREALPEFFEKMKDELRTADQGADTMIWLAASKSIPSEFKGGFIEDRVSVSKHLPLAWTSNTQVESTAFMLWLENKAKELNLLPSSAGKTANV